MKKLALYHPWIYLKAGAERVLLEIAHRIRYEVTFFYNYIDYENIFVEFQKLSKIHVLRLVHKTDLSFAGTANALVYFSWLMANAVVENNPLRIKQYINMLVSRGAIGLDGTEAVVK